MQGSTPADPYANHCKLQSLMYRERARSGHACLQDGNSRPFNARKMIDIHAQDIQKISISKVRLQVCLTLSRIIYRSLMFKEEGPEDCQTLNRIICRSVMYKGKGPEVFQTLNRITCRSLMYKEECPSCREKAVEADLRRNISLRQIIASIPKLRTVVDGLLGRVSSTLEDRRVSSLPSFRTESVFQNASPVLCQSLSGKLPKFAPVRMHVWAPSFPCETPPGLILDNIKNVLHVLQNAALLLSFNASMHLFFTVTMHLSCNATPRLCFNTSVLQRLTSSVLPRLTSSVRLPSPVLPRLFSSVLQCFPAFVLPRLTSPVLPRLTSSVLQCLNASALQCHTASVLQGGTAPVLMHLSAVTALCGALCGASGGDFGQIQLPHSE